MLNGVGKVGAIGWQMHNQEFLFRALRKDEIEAGNVPIPKGQKLFEDINFTGVVFDHQAGKLTLGVSTTPDLDRARVYARDGVVIKINREKIRELQIKELEINKILRSERISKPEDQEVILTRNNPDPFPSEIVEEVIFVNIENISTGGTTS